MEATTNEGERSRNLEVLRIEGHDLRSPIANIRSYASMALARKDDLDPRTRRALEVIAKNADRALGLIDEWMDLQRAEMGAIELTASPCPLGGLVRMAIADEAEALEAKRLRVETEIDDDLPRFELDANRVRAAVRALLAAAKRRAPEGSVLDVRVRPAGESVRVEVEDRGAPPSPEDAARSFDPAFQMLAARRMSPGLGMALAKQVAMAHGGEVGVEPLADGAVHYLRLPFART